MNVEVPAVEYADGFVFTRTFEQAQDDEGEPDLVTLRTRVTWSERNRHAFEEVTSYYYCTNKLK